MSKSLTQLSESKNKDTYRRTYIRRNLRGKPTITRITKPCGHCKTELPMTEYTIDRKEADGHANNCRACHAKARKAVNDRTHNNDFEQWSRALIYAARVREGKRGVPKDQRLHIASHVPVIAAELKKGVEEGRFKRRKGKSGPRRSSPTLSRLDHFKPNYSAGFVVETLSDNRIRGNDGPDELLLRGARWGASVMKKLLCDPLLPIQNTSSSAFSPS